MKVLIPSPLHSYTGGPRVEAEGESVAALLADHHQLLAVLARAS